MNILNLCRLVTKQDLYLLGLKTLAQSALAEGKNQNFVVTQLWGYDGSDYTDGLRIWAELGLPE